MTIEAATEQDTETNHSVRVREQLVAAWVEETIRCMC